MEVTGINADWLKSYQAMLDRRQQRIQSALDLLQIQEDSESVLQGIQQLVAFDDPSIERFILPFLDSELSSIRNQARRLLCGMETGLEQVLESCRKWGIDPKEDFRKFYLGDSESLVFSGHLLDWPTSSPEPSLMCQELIIHYDLTFTAIRRWQELLQSSDPVTKMRAFMVLRQPLYRFLPASGFKEPILECLRSGQEELILMAIPLALCLFQKQELTEEETLSHLVGLWESATARVRQDALIYLTYLWFYWRKDYQVSAGFQTQLSRILEAALKDPYPEHRLTALEFVIPPDAEAAEFALESVLQPGGSGNASVELHSIEHQVDFYLAEQLRAWPAELHPVLWKLLKPEDPIRNLYLWLEALKVDPVNWSELLEDWFTASKDARREAIEACRRAQLPIRAEHILLAVQEAGLEICQYLVESPHLAQAEREEYLLLLLEQTPYYKASIACEALWGDNLRALFNWFVSHPRAQEVKFGPGALIYLLEKDSVQQELSSAEYGQLLDLPGLKAILPKFLAVSYLNSRKADVVIRRVETGGSMLAPALAELLLSHESDLSAGVYAKLLAQLPANHACWQDDRSLDWLVHESQEVRIAVLGRWCQIVGLIPRQENIFELAALLSQDPVWQIRRAALYLLAQSGDPRHLSLVRQGLTDPYFKVRYLAIGLLARLEDRDSAALLMEWVRGDEMLCIRYAAARVLRDWGIWEKSLPDWASVDNLPYALWELMGLSPEHYQSTDMTLDYPLCFEEQDPFFHHLNLLGGDYVDPWSKPEDGAAETNRYNQTNFI